MMFSSQVMADSCRSIRRARRSRRLGRFAVFFRPQLGQFRFAIKAFGKALGEGFETGHFVLALVGEIETDQPAQAALAFAARGGAEDVFEVAQLSSGTAQIALAFEIQVAIPQLSERQTLHRASEIGEGFAWDGARLAQVGFMDGHDRVLAPCPAAPRESIAALKL